MGAVRMRYALASVAAIVLVAGPAGVAVADQVAGSAKTTKKKVSSNLEIDELTASGAKGSVSAKKGACENGRLVSLFHLNPTTQNFDLVTVVKTTRGGKFNAQASIVDGDVYAAGVGKKKITKTRVKNGRRTVRKTICKTDTTDPIQA